MKIAGREIPFDEVIDRVSAFAPATIRYYDLNGVETVAPSDGVTLEDLGRMTLMNPRLTGNDSANLLEAGRNAPWDAVPLKSSLVDADPSREGGLYHRAEELYSHFTSISGINDAKASKLLHLKRPYLYPVLDREVRGAYEAAAAKAASRLRSTTHKRMYWAAIREDLIANANELISLKDELGKKSLPHAMLPPVRLLDIIAWQIGRSDQGTRARS